MVVDSFDAVCNFLNMPLEEVATEFINFAQSLEKTSTSVLKIFEKHGKIFVYGENRTQRFLDQHFKKKTNK